MCIEYFNEFMQTSICQNNEFIDFYMDAVFNWTNIFVKESMSIEEMKYIIKKNGGKTATRKDIYKTFGMCKHYSNKIEKYQTFASFILSQFFFTKIYEVLDNNDDLTKKWSFTYRKWI
jgi:hypothetical protein